MESGNTVTIYRHKWRTQTVGFEAQALEEEWLQLDQDPQVHENVKTPVADGDRRRQILDSSVQDPDYKPSNSPRSGRELGWFYTSAQNAAFETLAVKRFCILSTQ